jgi:hypothetical protein
MMLKPSGNELDLERSAAMRLRELIANVPAIHDVEVEHEVGPPGHKLDFAMRFKVGSRNHVMICEVKSSGQPRYVRNAIHQLSYVQGSFPRATPVFVAPYLSEEAQSLCTDAGVGYADLEGNCRLAFDSVFIERQVATRPPAVRRELRSVFRPKSAQILRRLLRDPQLTWKVVDLAEESHTSLGQVSNVRRALLQKEWASAHSAGLQLTAPDELLDAWRDSYDPPAGERIAAYTPLHGRQLDEALRKATLESNGQIALASFTAAKWIAPYARGATDVIYVDREGWAALRRHVEVAPLSRGENLQVVVLEDQGPLLDAILMAPGRMVTSPVQTYLDLWASGERGREAAEHLRREALAWSK